ncbi:MAG: carbon starvation protein A [Candidatus Omnitrophica bacterium]|nr:carbon starvation protein A [Candidatus Omnitrophota bacterium]MCM8828640.1 carbon starvation protein A [Candidatus Omnitrophota bacterium]
MNSTGLLILVLISFAIAFKFYGRYLERIWDTKSEEKTPAHTKYDGIDYVPAKHWIILFGHHFSSIAGAGPILGPVIAGVLWGWGPALLWIVLGSVFLGGVHDFSSLVLSLKHNGETIGQITKNILGEKSKIVFSFFLWLSLILVIAVFAAVTAKTFIEEPRIVIPSFVFIFIAILFGFLVYRKNANFILVTIVSILLIAFFLYVGKNIPVRIPLENPIKIWIAILLLYAFVASVMPVNILLQPRDYLSSFILFFGLFFGVLGIFVSHPSTNAPFFVSFNSPKGPLVPMMFVMIACGAISGFHSLVSSGTTSKQIPDARHSRRIAYGSMLTEGVLASMALVCVVAGLYWNSPFQDLNYPFLMQKGNWIGTFATGYGRIVSGMFSSDIGKLIAIIMVNSFVLTTLDTATRITRYITAEMFGQSFRMPIFNNRFFATFCVIAFAAYLAYGAWEKIWPVFGASNQLTAGLVLFVCGCFLMIKKKNSLSCLIPAIVMLVITIFALIYQAIVFYKSRSLLLGNISVVLIILSFFIIVEGITRIKALRRNV